MNDDLNTLLQNKLLENLTQIMRVSRSRVNDKLDFLSPEDQNKVDAIVWREIKGIVHGVLCEFDGATSLADVGLLYIIDEEGGRLERFLHEKLFNLFTDDESKDA